MTPMNVKGSKLTIDAEGLRVEGVPEEDGRVFYFFVPSAIIMSAGMSLVATHDHTYRLTVGGNSFNLGADGGVMTETETKTGRRTDGHRDTPPYMISTAEAECSQCCWYQEGTADEVAAAFRRHVDDTLTAADRYATNEAKQREAGDADGAPSVTAPAADNPGDDAVDGEEGERRYLNAQTSSGDHEQQEH